MSYTPTNWNTGDTITAAAMNKIENGIANAGGGGYDAVIKLTNETSGYDIPTNLTVAIISGTYAGIAAKLENNEIPVILVCYENTTFNIKWAMPISCVIYYAPAATIPFFNFYAGGYLKQPTGDGDFVMTMLDSTSLVWDAEDVLAWD